MYNLPAKLILQLHIVVELAFLTDFIGKNLLSVAIFTPGLVILERYCITISYISHFILLI